MKAARRIDILKIKVLMNDPCGLTWKRLHQIMPRLGEKYEVEVEEISQAREEYRSESYRASGLPPAPAVMMEDEVAGQGPEIPAEKIEAAIRRHLGLPPLAHSIENIPLGENHAQSQMFL